MITHLSPSSGPMHMWWVFIKKDTFMRLQLLSMREWRFQSLVLKTPAKVAVSELSVCIVKWDLYLATYSIWHVFWQSSSAHFDHRVHRIIMKYRGGKYISFHKYLATCTQGLNLKHSHTYHIKKCPVAYLWVTSMVVFLCMHACVHTVQLIIPILALRALQNTKG